MLVVLAYAGRLSTSAPPQRDILFRWELAIVTLIGDAVLLGFMLLIARGAPLRDVFALRRPVSWPDALRIGVVVIVATYAVSAVLGTVFGDNAREQAMPVFWDGSRLPAFLANLAVVAVFVPIVEEATVRGLGYRLLEPYGVRVAIVGSALSFALLHGAIVDFPWVLTVGLGAGYLRARSGSLFPSMALHATINGIAVVVAGFAGANGLS